VFLLNPLVFKQTHVKAHSNVRLTPALQGSSPCHLPEPFAYDLFDCKRRQGKKYPQLALSQKADKKRRGKIRISLPPLRFWSSALCGEISAKGGKKGVFEWESQPQEHFVSVCHL